MTIVSPDPRLIIGNVPGRICHSPTDMSLDYPHGGVDVGEVADCYFTLMRPRSIVRDEVTGFNTTEIVTHGESCAMFIALREHNLAGYGVFLDATEGTDSGAPVVRSGERDQPGRLNRDDSKVFLFAPYDHVNDPYVHFPVGIPLIEETSRIMAMLGGPGDMWVLPAVIEAVGNGSSTNIWECGVRDDITL